uniref:Histone deacetylase complex subunit SAP130 C-terminal domain-containing protein n=1 Tax=Timema cristinae TaxID=61476 RepID=A0A7R9CBC6_TIMCR|nr:unnamed protein product [Timema cristinae]
MSSIPVEGKDSSQERHPMDLAAKTNLMKPMEPTRQNLAVQQIGQLRGGRATGTSIQSISMTSTNSASQTGISTFSQTMLKQVNVSRSSLVQSASPSSASLPSRSPLVSVAHTTHVPRGAAAVANIAAPRSAVATPIVRPTGPLQTTGVSAPPLSASFASSLRGLGPATLMPRAASPASTASVAPWLGTSVPQVVSTTAISSTGAMLTSLRTQNITSMSAYAHGRPTIPTVPSRPPTPLGSRIQSESPRPQLIHSTTQKSIVGQTSTQLHITEKYFKPSVSLGAVTIAQVLPTRTQTAITYSSGSPFPASPATLIATTPTRLAAVSSGQRLVQTTPARLTMSPASTAMLSTPTRLAVAAQGSTQSTIITGPARLTVSTTLPGTVLAGSARVAMTGQGTVTRLAMPSSSPIRPPVPNQQTTHTRLCSPQSGLLSTPARLTVSSTNQPPLQATTVLATQARLTVAPGVSTPTGMVSLHPVVVSNTSQPLKSVPPVSRALPIQQNMGAKVITQPAHGSIQITQVPLSSGKVAHSLHSVTPLQHNQGTRTVSYPSTTTVASSNVPGIRPITVAHPQSIPVAKVFTTAMGVSRSGVDLNTTGLPEVALPVHTIQTQPQPPPPSQQQQTMPQATSVYIQTSHRASPAPSNQTTASSVPTYTMPTTFYYEAPSGGYQVTRPYTPGSSYAVHTTTSQPLRPTNTVHTIVPSGPSVRFNPVMVVDHSRSSLPVQSSYINEGKFSKYLLGYLFQEISPMKAQKNLTPMLAALSSSPVSPPSPRRPDSRGNGGNSSGGSTTISATSSPGLNEAGEDSLPAIVKNEIVDEIEKPPMEMSPRKKPRKQQLTHLRVVGRKLRVRVRRVTAVNQAGRKVRRVTAMNRAGIKVITGNELPEPKFSDEEMEFLPEEKVREVKEVLVTSFVHRTGNELPEPKFSDEEMEFLPEEKVREVKEVAATALREEPEEKVFVPKRPHISLINSYRHPWKSKHNHFIRYSDVKPKDERRPTITDLGNQKNVLQKLNGWKIFHLSTQMEDLADVETQAIEKLSAILKVMERKTGKELEKDVNRSNELIKGNMQRSKIIKDQMKEAESQVMKIFDHKGHATDIVNKCANKRSLKKREKL